MPRLAVREDLCIGCHLCEVWCTVEHSESKDLIRCFNQKTDGALPRVRVEERKPVTFPVQCRQCPEPVCVFSCPSGAMGRDANGVIRVETSRCRGCWTCVLVCPFGAVRRGPGFAVKCDMCPSKGIPACVEHCPNQAISLEIDGS